MCVCVLHLICHAQIRVVPYWLQGFQYSIGGSINEVSLHGRPLSVPEVLYNLGHEGRRKTKLVLKNLIGVIYTLWCDYQIDYITNYGIIRGYISQTKTYV